jgi:large subunit ribosomal protein L25
MAESTDIHITVERREELGKEAVGRLRRAGKIPAVVYGGDKESVPIFVDRESLMNLLKQESGENTIFLLKLKGTKSERRAIIKDIQVDPITREFQHIDFIRVTRGHKLTVTMPVELVGDSVGVRQGGRLNFISRELTVEVLPREMFDKLVIDISDLDVGDNVTVADLEDQLPASGRFVEESSRVVLVIAMPRGISEEEEEAEEELVIGEQAEPEVIHGKGGQEEEGGGEA